MRLLYALLTYLLTPVLLLYLLWRSLSNPGYRRRMGERFGFGKARLASDSIWVHAVSVGEVQAAAMLVRELLARYPDRPLVLTTMTPTGSERARDLFGGRVVHNYLPYDTISAVRLLGAQVILTGVRPAIAQTLVHLGVNLSDVITRPSLVAGLVMALDSLSLQVTTSRRTAEKEA